MKTCWWVDLPNPAIAGPDDSNVLRVAPSDDAGYIHVGTFRTRAEAEQFLMDLYGITEGPVADFFITEGEE